MKIQWQESYGMYKINDLTGTWYERVGGGIRDDVYILNEMADLGFNVINMTGDGDYLLRG